MKRKSPRTRAVDAPNRIEAVEPRILLAGVTVITNGFQFSGTTYEVVVGPMISAGSVMVQVPAGAAIDSAGNANKASTSTDNGVTYANTNRKSWTGEVSSDWFDAGNWNPAGVPTAGDEIAVNGGAVSLASTTATAFFDQLFLNSGSITWSSGSFAGTVTTAPISVVNVWGDAQRTMGIFNNGGTFNWSGTGVLHAGGGLAVDNLPGGLFDVRGDGVMRHGWGAQPVFNNAGTFRKSGGVGTTRFEAVPFNNTGTVEALRGVLAFEAGYLQGPDGTLKFRLAGSEPGIGFGRLDVSGPVTLGGALSIVPSFAAAGGEEFVIITNDGSDAVSGTFTGLPEGAVFAAAGQRFRISYFGGTGNDVSLKAIRSAVTGRHVFYNRSSFDGNDGAAGAADDAGIATDKAALLPGAPSTWANVTSYSRGINGVMVDIADLPDGATEISVDDFDFAGGAMPTSVSVRRGAGVDGSDRVTLIWADYSPLANPASTAVGNGWLRVTVKANANTGLASPDVFSFGNVIGDTGDSATAFRVNALDLGRVKQQLNRASDITGRFDFNRDGRVNALDLGLVKANLNKSLSTITAAASASASPFLSVAPVANLAGEASARRVWDEPAAPLL